MAQAPRIAIITTSHAAMGDTGEKTGVWLEELTAPYYAFKDRGAEVVVASIAGGEVPVDPRSTEDEEKPESVTRFLNDAEAQAAAKDTRPVSALKAEDFDAIFLPGGHGTMWDLPGDSHLARLVAEMIEAQKVVSAVCHGPAGLLGAKRKDGRPVVEGRRVNAFTNEEEAAVGLDKAVPFLLETRLRELGAEFDHVGAFTPYAITDGNLITGQNPMSSEKVAEAVMAALEKREAA